MAKSKQQKLTENKPVAAPVTGISGRGKKVIIAGMVLLALGFFILTKTDPKGQNWASVLSPFLIIGAYITIGIGIILPEAKKNEQE